MKWIRKFAAVSIVVVLGFCATGNAIDAEEKWDNDQDEIVELFREMRFTYPDMDHPYQLFASMGTYKDGFDYDFIMMYPLWLEGDTRWYISEDTAKVAQKRVLISCGLLYINLIGIMLGKNPYPCIQGKND